MAAHRFHGFETGHFALATHGDEIGTLVRSFLDRVTGAPAGPLTTTD